VETIYVMLMCGVALAIVATVVDAIASVHRKAVWAVSSPTVAFVERRTQNLPYVGIERRKANRVEKESRPEPAVEVEVEALRQRIAA